MALAGIVFILTAAAVLVYAAKGSMFGKSRKRFARKLKRVFAGSKKSAEADIAEQKEDEEETERENPSIFIPPTFKLILATVGLCAFTYWLTGWWAMTLLMFLAVQVTPYMSVANTQRAKNIQAISNAEKMCNNIISIIGSGAATEMAIAESLKNPTVEFKKGAAKVLIKYRQDVNAGILELKKQLGHSIGDMLCVTLAYVVNSPATGNVLESLRGISDAASELMKMEKRTMVKQKEGFFSAKTTMWMSLAIMLSQVRFGTNYDVYDSLTGQGVLLGIGMVMAFGVWLTINLSKGKGMVRISFSPETVSKYVQRS